VSATLVATNVCALDSWADNAGLSTNEDARIKRIAVECKKVGADIILANELVTYQNAEVFSKAMGWGGQHVDPKTLKVKKGDSCICKGDGGVSMGFIWNPDVFDPYWFKLIDGYPAWNRNRWSLACRGYLDGKRVGLLGVHLEFMPKGTNKIKKYDTVRYEQIDGALDMVMSPNQSWVVLGDENHASSDKPDAPGNAAKKHGLVNVDTGNIIRAQMTKDIKKGKPRMVKLGTATDHPMLVIPDVIVPK